MQVSEWKINVIIHKVYSVPTNNTSYFLKTKHILIARKFEHSLNPESKQQN